METYADKTKETKNYVVYTSDDLGTIYVPKKWVETLGNPKNIKITVEAG